MPFGCYNAVKVMSDSPQVAKEDKVIKKDNVMELSILLTGRTVASLTDFVAGLHDNLTQIANTVGLALFSNDPVTTRVLLQQQKQIPALLTEGDNVSYKLCDGVSETAIRKTFYLMLSKAGIQSFSFKINFKCATTEDILSNGIPACDMLWSLADAPFFEENQTAYDRYIPNAAALITGAKENNLPVFLLAGQFEKLGKIRNSDDVCFITNDLFSSLTKCISNKLGEIADYCTILPVQIYGGLIFKEIDADGSLVFGGNRYGGLRSYNPLACHIPLLYALEQINTGEQFAANEIVAKIKQLNRAQQTVFLSAGIVTGE